MSLGIGQPAPDFELRDQHGQSVRLSDFRGRRAVVVMFYPFAFSRVCTGELEAVRDALPAFESADVQLVAVSCDPMFALRSFAEQAGLTFPLLSDFWPHGEVARSFGVFDETRGCAGRSTFIVDKGGTVRWLVHNAMPDARDLEEQARALAVVA
ncbi:MAG TPA: peroxiredoxin [Nocardioidaceae bacterium]|nr:peroxiredoxin [Nocardioidaceae bacterium]